MLNKTNRLHIKYKSTDNIHYITMMFVLEGKRFRVPNFQENYMFIVLCFLFLLQIFNFILKQLLDFMLLQRENLNSQIEEHDMRYIKNILQIEYARVSRKVCFEGNFYYE